MSQAKTDQEIIATTHNLARYSVENRQVVWIILFLCLIWGVYAYFAMEKRKDPLYSNLYAAAVCQWPGASAARVEELVTRKIEEKIAENMKVREIKSVSRSNSCVITIKLDDRIKNTNAEFDDLALRLKAMNDLPQGAGPIVFMKDYQDVTTLMLTVASPRASPVEVSLRADGVKKAIAAVRRRAPPVVKNRLSLIVCFPYTTAPEIPRHQCDLFAEYARDSGLFRDVITLNGSGFVGVDAESDQSDQAILKSIESFVTTRLKVDQLHPDLWRPAIIRDPSTTKEQLAAVAGEKYSYADLDRFTDLIKRTLQTVPEVARVTRLGVLAEQVNLDFSQQRLASYGIVPQDFKDKLETRNIDSPAGVLEVGGKLVRVSASGAFGSEKDLGSVVITNTESGDPVYLRDLVEINRGYESPARYLNYLTWKDDKGIWHRTRAVTLSVFMRAEEHIDDFAKVVNASLADIKQRLPDDLIVARTSDQPVQVEDNVDLFMTSLYEAIGLVILTALIGFWEWRTATVIALSMPITLAMTFGMMYVLGIDLQQCSIASLIIALGLLVDDPVVAGDAIKHALANGHSRLVAAWLGPTKLAHAILFATLTNISAYLPLLMMPGQIGEFLYSLPIVITCSLVASRLASMTFVPLLGYYLLRAPKEKVDDPSSWKHRVHDTYMNVGHWVLDRRRMIMTGAIALIAVGFISNSGIKTSFFPNDEFNLCWIDVWLPEDAPLSATDAAVTHVEEVVKEATRQFGVDHPDRNGKPREILKVMTAFVGGAGPRFWDSILQELDQLNYSQLLIETTDKHDTERLVPYLQKELDKKIPEARCDARALESGEPVGVPISVRVSGSDPATLRSLARQLAEILRGCPLAERVRDDWGAGTFTARLKIDPDKANLVGLTNSDIAGSSLAGLNGYQVDTLREGNKQIPIVARLRADESSQIQSLSNLYVYAGSSQDKVALPSVATVSYEIEPEKIARRNQFRTITVGAFPSDGVLTSEVMEAIHPALDKFKETIPPGYKMEIGGMEGEQVKSFIQMSVVMCVSIVLIFLCLLVQFKNAVKPLLVFCGLPAGILGAIIGLNIMNSPFGFSAFMGVASLAGVIVSHVIVLFDFIEEGHEHGMELRDALLQAVSMRLRPVVVTVAATVLGFIPLAIHGGPLWEPLCYAQIGGLTLATFSTLILVPIVYAIAVLDLKIVSWKNLPNDSLSPAEH